MPSLQNHLSANRKVRCNARRRSRAKGQAATRSSLETSDGFLKQTFYPLSTIPLPSIAQIRKIEQSLNTSLKHLCHLYQFDDIQLPSVPYPMNICSAFNIVKQKMQTRDREIQIMITGTVQEPYLTTAKKMSTGYQLYYIPLSPLHHLLSHSATQPLGKLLLSAYSYLHQAGVSCCDANSFIGYEMQFVLDSFRDGSSNLTEQELIEREREAEHIIHCCDQLCQSITDLNEVLAFTQRLRNIEDSDRKERKLIGTIRQIHSLFMKYPNRTFTDNMNSEMLEEKEEATMCVGEYLSFYWGGNTAFDEQLSEWIDSSLQEMIYINEPVSIQVFDRPQTRQTHDFRFEERFLQAITHLNIALYEY